MYREVLRNVGLRSSQLLMKQTVDLFIRSYYRDFEWLRYCLESIENYCFGFSSIILVIPRGDADRLQLMSMSEKVSVHYCDRYNNDYLGQQVTKLNADRYSTADFICHIDSDCVFRKPVVPSDLFDGNKPTFVITPYTLLPNDLGWRSMSERFTGRSVEFDFMRRQPLVFPRHLYEEVRMFCSRRFKSDITEHVLSQESNGFSEFNVLGAYSYYECNDVFSWNKRLRVDVDEEICRWFWSWTGITEDVRGEISSILSK